MDQLADNVATLENELASVTARVALAERRLADTVAQRKLTEARVATLQADVRSIMNALYRERSGQYLQLMSQSASLSDLLIKLDYANMSGKHNVQVITNLKTAAASLKDQQAQQVQQTVELKALQTERQGKLDALKGRRREQQALLAQLRKSEAGQRTIAVRTQAQQALTAKSIDDLVGKVVQERAHIEAERKRRLEEERKRREAEAKRIREEQERARLEAIRLAKLRAEQERRAREAQLARERAAAAAAAEAQRQRELALQREQAALKARREQVARQQQAVTQELAPLPVQRQSGPVGFPLPGGSVAAPYGTSGAQWAVLSGADGTQATAALEGNVIAATYYASLGWIVLLDHGSGIVTGYFGLQSASINVGDRVSRGTPVGIIGGSPIFGPGRMAFQIRQNGTPVAPNF